MICKVLVIFLVPFLKLALWDDPLSLEVVASDSRSGGVRLLNLPLNFVLDESHVIWEFSQVVGLIHVVLLVPFL